MIVVRWWPVAIFWAVVVTAFGVALLGVLSPVLLVLPWVAAYVLGRYAPRRVVWTAAVPVVPFVLIWVWKGGPWWDAVAVAAIFGGSVLLGWTMRTRRDYLKALEERARSLEQLSMAAERTRIAREMHDIVAHNLAVIVALADGAVASSASAPTRSADLMVKVSATGRQALAEVRQLIGLLRDDAHAVADLDGLVEQVRAAGLQVRLVREGQPGVGGAGMDVTVYRIVQEALTNTLKHAGPDAGATARISYDATGVDVEVVDDGGGREAVPAEGGNGLTWMRERAAAYGGVVSAGPVDGGGWRVTTRLTLPS
jgi:signal transduction histidine kinase